MQIPTSIPPDNMHTAAPLASLDFVIRATRSLRAAAFITALAAGFLASPSVKAATDYWTNTGTGNNLSNSSSLWSNAAVPVSGDVWSFNSSNAAGQTLTNNYSGWVSAGILFTNAGNITIAGNAFTLTGGGITNQTVSGTETFNPAITLGSNATVANLNAGGTLVFNGGISQGANTLTFGGKGNFLLGGSNSYTGTGASLNISGSEILTILNGGSYTAANGNNFATMQNYGGSAVINVAGGGSLNAYQLLMAGYASNAINYFTNNGSVTLNTLYLMGYTNGVLGGTNIYVQNGGTSTITSLLIGQGNATNRLSQSALNKVIVQGGLLNETNGAIYLGGNGSNSTNQLIVTAGQLVASGGNGIVFGNNTTNQSGINMVNQIQLGGGTMTVAKFGYASNVVTGTTNSLSWSSGAVLQAATNTTANFMAASTITGNPTLAVSMGTNGGVFDVNGFNNTIGVNIADGTANNSGSLTVTDSAAGAGTLTLGASNSFSGLTVNNMNATVILQDPGAAGASNGTLNIAAGTLRNYSNSISIGNVSLGNGTITGSGTITGASINATNTGTASIANTLNGTGGFTQSGTGTTTLSSPNGFSGGTTVRAGTLVVGNANALGSTNGGLNIASGTLSNSAYSVSIGNVSLGNGSITGSGIITGASFTATNTGAASIANTLSGSAAFTQSGTGTTTLSGSNSFSGGNKVSAGTLVVGSANALGSTNGGLNIASGALSNDAYSISLGNVSLGNGSITGSGTITGTSFTATNTGVASIANTLSGTGGFTQSGTGTTTLSGSSSFSGTTTLTAGTLALINSNALSGTTNISLGSYSSRGTLDATSLAGYSLGTAQTLSGYGRVSVGMANTLTVNGKLAPGGGGSPGVVSIAGNLGIGSGAFTTIQIAGISGSAGATNGYDQLSVLGSLNAGGNLAINTLSGLNVVDTSTSTYFQQKVFNAASGISGNFTAVTLYGVINGIDLTGSGVSLNYYAANNTWQVWDNQTVSGTPQSFYAGIDMNTGVLTVVPEPATYALLGVGGLSLFLAYRRRRE